MRTPALLVLAAAAGFALAWLLVARLPSHHPLPATTAAPAPPAPPPHVDAAPAPPAAPPASPPPPPAVPEAPPPDKPPPAEPPPPDVTGADDATDDAATSDDGDQDAAPGPEPIDADAAADLMADWLAHQDLDAEAKGDAADAAVREWKAFGAEQPDPNWSDATEQQLEDALYGWIDGLPDEVRQHIAIVHIECRETLCQVLAADNDAATQNERSQNGQEWQQAIATLPYQSWWNDLGFVDSQTSVMTSEDGSHLLYQTYLRREVKPPPPG